MSIAGYVPAIGETDLNKVIRSVRNIYENGAASADLATVATTGAYNDLTALASIAVGSFTRDISTPSGSQAVTGVGFKPRLLILGAAFGGADYSLGISDGTHDRSLFIVTGGNNVNTTVSIVVGVDGSNLQTAAVASFDTDGFTTAWTKTGLPTGTATIMYLAHR